MSNEQRIYDRNIAEMNGRIDSAMLDIRRRLNADPDAIISDLVKLLHSFDSSRRISIQEKRKLNRNACERFDGRRREDALA